MDKCTDAKIFDQIFRDQSQKVAIHLRSSKSKGNNYDPFRDLSYEITKSNPLWVRALIRQITSNALIFKEMGLTESGALQIIIKKNDLSLVKMAERIEIDGEKYYLFQDAIGNKFQTFQLPVSYTKVILSRRDT